MSLRVGKPGDRIHCRENLIVTRIHARSADMQTNNKHQEKLRVGGGVAASVSGSMVKMELLGT